MRKYGFRMAGCCLAAAFGAMAFAATAQAEVGAHWNVNGSSVSTELVTRGVVPEATLENSHGQLLGHALGKELNVLCTSMHLEEAKLKLEGSSLGKFRFVGCRITTNGGEVLPACEPHTGEEKGVILTKLLKGLIVLHEGTALNRIEPEEGTRLVEIATSLSCAFGPNIPVIGKFFVKDCNGAFRVEDFTHLFEEGPLTELWVISKTEEHKSAIDGSALASLTGEHAPFKWSGTPA
jgi:hypothetical protein